MQCKVGFGSQAMQSFSESQSNPPEISIEQAYSPELISRLRGGSLDAVFATRIDGSEDLNHILVWSQPLVLGVHRENPLSKKKSISVEELCKYEILTYAITSPANHSLEENLPIENMSLKRKYDDEITLSAMVSSDKNKMALFAIHFSKCFEDVVCIPIKDLPIDFHKVYLISRRETHSKVVDDLISFMGAYRFPNSLELGQIK